MRRHRAGWAIQFLCPHAHLNVNCLGNGRCPAVHVQAKLCCARLRTSLSCRGRGFWVFYADRQGDSELATLPPCSLLPVRALYILQLTYQIRSCQANARRQQKPPLPDKTPCLPETAKHVCWTGGTESAPTAVLGQAADVADDLSVVKLLDPCMPRLERYRQTREQENVYCAPPRVCLQPTVL